MDPYGNIYDVEEMRRLLNADGDENWPDAEQEMSKDKARLDGYLKGLSEGQIAEAEQRLRERLRAPFGKS